MIIDLEQERMKRVLRHCGQELDRMAKAKTDIELWYQDDDGTWKNIEELKK